LDDPSPANYHSLSRQHATNPGKNRLATCGELHLDEFVARRPGQPRGNHLRLDQSAGFGSKGESTRRFGIIKWLDAKRVSREDQLARSRVVERDRVHSAKVRRETEPITPVEMERQLAIGRGGEDSRPPTAEFTSKLDVIVDLAVGDQRRAAGFVEGL